jgi:hypothetical protein
MSKLKYFQAVELVAFITMVAVSFAASLSVFSQAATIKAEANKIESLKFIFRIFSEPQK